MPDEILAAPLVAGKANQIVLIASPIHYVRSLRRPSASTTEGSTPVLPNPKPCFRECAQKFVSVRFLIPESLPSGSRVDRSILRKHYRVFVITPSPNAAFDLATEWYRKLVPYSL